MADEYFAGSGDQYFVDSPSYNVDRKLEQPISAKPSKERKDYATGTDPGGPLTAGIIGVTSNPMEHQTRAMQASLKLGASRVELGAMGVGKGSAQSPTPESYGKLEREEIRNLAKINKVQTTFHAAPSVSMLSGLTQQGFSEQAREGALNEIKKAVSFAAEASTGGAVVVHFDEWERPIESQYGLDKTAAKDKKNEKAHAFQSYEGEFKTKPEDGGHVSGYGPSSISFVDTETQQIQTIRRDMEFVEPEIIAVKKQTDDGVTVDRSTGNKVKGKSSHFFQYKYKGQEDGTPSDDTDPSTYSTKTLYYDDIIKKEQDMNDPENENFKDNVEYMKEYFTPLYKKWEEINAMKEENPGDELKKKDEIFLFHFLRQKAYQAYDQYLSAENYYEHFNDNDTPKAREHNVERMRRAWSDFQKQLTSVNKFQTMEEYGTNKSSQTIAEAALYARERSLGNKGLDRNLYIAPESVFPEKYGSHPDEMKDIIDKSRDKMAKQLETNMGKEAAEKEAAKFIKATFDIGHMNMWRRYFVRKDDESSEDYNKRFNKWALNKSKELADEGYIGHVHMSDNFGFSDEHLSVGQGNAPIQEFVKNMRDSGKVDDFIVEVGSYNAQSALGEAWEELGAGIASKYLKSGAASPNPRYFGSARNSYFGHTRKPSYVFGQYVPMIPGDKWQGWSPWSGSPL